MAGFARVSANASSMNSVHVPSSMVPVGPCIGAIASIQRPPLSHGIVESYFAARAAPQLKMAAVHDSHPPWEIP
jgi:hypothetical protein